MTEKNPIKIALLYYYLSYRRWHCEGLKGQVRLWRRKWIGSRTFMHEECGGGGGLAVGLSCMRSVEAEVDWQ